MRRREICPAEYAGVIDKALDQGAFLTTKAGDKIDSMVIGWGHIGRIWNRPVFIAFVRYNRYTKEMLDANSVFTVNIPTKGMDAKAFDICGTLSGRDIDKIKEAGLTLVPGEAVSAPAIKEFPLTLECRVIYQADHDISGLPQEIRGQFYPGETKGHTAYYGEIVRAYILEGE